MASIYLDNLPFFRNIVAVASEQLIKQANTPTTSDASRSSNQDSENTSDISGIRICARIRPLIKEEGDENHITGVLAKGKDQAVLFEPRVKFRRAAIPDATVSFVVNLLGDHRANYGSRDMNFHWIGSMMGRLGRMSFMRKV